MSLQPNKYQLILNGLKEKIRQARFKAALTANAQMLAMYWEVGQTIIQQEIEDGWGAKTVEKLSADLRAEFEDMKGLSVRNLRYMRQFTKAYPHFSILQPPVAKLPQTKKLKTGTEFVQQPAVQIQLGNNDANTILQPLVAQIPWTHHTIILDRVKAMEERLFYLQKTLENGWSKAVLSLQIESKLYQREGKSINNFKNSLPAIDSDLAIATFKNPYVFDFLAMSEKMQERDLEKALLQHLKVFMLELGKGFAYVGNQKNIVAGGDDFFLDLLFYNYHLHCFVVFELKIGDFKSEYAGKLNFYVNTINAQLKSQLDKPTIGILLCKTPNETVIKHSLQNIISSIGVSDYKLANGLPKQLKGEMPTMKELEAEIEKELTALKKPVDKKYDRLKELIGELKQPKVKQKRSPKTCENVFTNVVVPIRDQLKNALAKIIKEFSATEIMVFVDTQGHTTDAATLAHIKKQKECNEYRIEMRFRGFKPAGIKAFDIWKDIYIETDIYYYSICLTKQHPKHNLLEKLYHELPNTKEFETIVDECTASIYEDITQQVERLKKEVQK